MPRTRIRTTDRGSWNEATLKNAIAAIKKGRKLREISQSFHIPISTLHNRLTSGKVTKPKMGRKSLFSPSQEQEIANIVTSLTKQFYGVTSFELRRLAYQYAEAHDIKNNFNNSTRLAGKDWLSGFMKRNPHLKFKRLETRSNKKMLSLNKVEVNKFFINLKMFMEKYAFLPSRIYNVDEINISNLKKCHISNSTESKHIQINNWDEGFTLCCAASANGVFVPPMYIFPNTKMPPMIRECGPLGSIYKTSKLGSMNEELFRDWLEHFSNFSNSSPQDPVLLILDNHSSHMSYYIHDYCKEKGIVLISIPLNSSHKLLPLDVIFYGQLMSEFKKECDASINCNPNSDLNPLDLCHVFNNIYIKMATKENAVSGFELSGIYPLNQEVFSEKDYMSIDNEDNNEEDEENNANMKQDYLEEIEIEYKIKDETAGQTTDGDTSEEDKEFFENEIAPYLSPVKDTHKNDLDRQYLGIMMEATENEEEVHSSENETQEIQYELYKKDSEDLILDVCCICGEHGREEEIWFKCTTCTNRSHAECSGWNQPVGYKCDFCLS